MTNPEFTTFIDRLFVAFPSLHEWLQGSYKPEETQRVWRSTLATFKLDECMSVVQRWTSGALEPFAAYERDKVHLIVRSICSADRDRIRKSRERAAMAAPYREKREWQGEPIGVGSGFDSDMVSSVKEGAIEYKRFLDGEISKVQYLDAREEICKRHGI